MGKKEKRSSVISRIDPDKVVRLFLRSLTLSIIPGPELYDILKDIQSSRTDIGMKVKHVAESLTEASKVLNDLQNDLSNKVNAVNKLREDYEKYEQLAKVEELKAQAIIKQLDEALGKNKPKERWIALGINLVAGIFVFILGIVFGPWIKIWLNIGM